MLLHVLMVVGLDLDELGNVENCISWGSVHFYCDVCRNPFGGEKRNLVSESLFDSTPYTEQSFYLVSSPQIPADEFTHLFSFTNKKRT